MKAETIYNCPSVQNPRQEFRGCYAAQPRKARSNSVLRRASSLLAAVFLSTCSVYAASATATVGQPVSLSVVTDGTAPFSYQWFKNGAVLSGATAATYSIASVGTSNSGDYGVTVTNSAGSVTSDVATLTVTAALTVPSITSQPSALTVVAGQAASFNVTATGSSTLTYQWKKNGTAISGATSPSYSISSTTTADAGNYSVVVTNSVGVANSTAALLSVTTPVAPPITPTTLQDTSFEKFSVGANFFDAFAYSPKGTPWTFTGSAGVTGNNSGFTWANPTSPDGVQVAFIQWNGSVAQDVVLAAGTYTITALVANRASWGGQQSVLVYVDSALVGTFKGGPNYSLAVSNSFTVTAGTHSIDFVGTATTDSTLFLDQITLAGASVAIGNSSFENPNVATGSYSAFQYNPATVAGVQDWTFVGYSGVTGNNSGFTSGNSAAPNGNQVAFLQSTGSAISQSLNFPTTCAYTLSLSTAQRGNWNMAPQKANVYLDGVLMGTFSPANAAYQTVSIPLPTTAGTHVLSFKGMTSSDSTLFIDRLAIYLP